MSAITLRCPAKINLGLHVLAKRPDGYHELDSIMLKINDLADILTITKIDDIDAPTIELSIQQQSGTEILPVNEKNLVYKAASLYLAQYPENCKIKVHLEKHIPIAAGLGGGSSDAANTLKGLATLLPSAIDINALALELGSDVPFFLLDSLAARMQGRGEILKPLELSLDGWHLLLVNPRIAVSAGKAYSLLDTFDTPLPLVSIMNALANKTPLSLHNGLQKGVLLNYPIINNLVKDLQRDHDTVLMSGSGSTCFVLTPSPIIRTHIPKEYWSTAVTF